VGKRKKKLWCQSNIGLESEKGRGGVSYIYAYSTYIYKYIHPDPRVPGKLQFACAAVVFVERVPLRVKISHSYICVEYAGHPRESDYGAAVGKRKKKLWRESNIGLESGRKGGAVIYMHTVQSCTCIQYTYTHKPRPSCSRKASVCVCRCGDRGACARVCQDLPCIHIHRVYRPATGA